MPSKTDTDMIVPEELLSCCTFVGYKKTDGTEVWGGTAFYVSRPGKDPCVSFRYTVTAAHVIQNIIDTGVDQVLLRCNKKKGGVGYEETKPTDWLLHPSRKECDVAVLVGVPDGAWDIKALCDTLIVPREALSACHISIGTDVFWTGLFTSHVGSTRNETIVRTGHIAGLPADGVSTQLGLMRAYLIDGVPLGGFSGAPVFSNHGTLKSEGSVLVTADRPVIRLIGMLHGHFTIKQATVEGWGTPANMAPSIHTGIGIVIPADDILEMLNLPAIQEIEERLNGAAH